MKTAPIPTRPLTDDALRCLALFERFGRRRAGSWLRKSALLVLQDDPSFDLWRGVRALLRRGLITVLEDDERLALTTAGADRLRELRAEQDRHDRQPEAAAPGGRLRPVAA